MHLIYSHDMTERQWLLLLASERMYQERRAFRTPAKASVSPLVTSG